MHIIDLPRKEFENLEPLVLGSKIMNTEAELFLIHEKDRWEKKVEVLKKLHHDTGTLFSNKLYTINELLDKKEEINIEELVMPTHLATVDRKVVGFTMPYIDNINFKEVLDSSEFSVAEKISYLKEIGAILEKMKRRRCHSRVSDFYLNDIHENNFILNKRTGKINVVDLDSSKIGHNLVAPSKYLSPVSKIMEFPSKYEQIFKSVGGVINPSYNSEIYCYIIMIFNFIYGGNINNISFKEFYIYLEYLSKIGISKELLDKLSYIYTSRDNENPYEYLDELISFYGRTHKNTFNSVRKRTLY